MSMLQNSLTAAALAIAIAVYVGWVRPTIRNLPHVKAFYDQADTFWARVIVWVRVQWDALVAVLLIVWPSIPDVLEQLAGFDMSGLIPSETASVVSKILGVLVVVLRAVNLARATRG